MRIKMIEDKNKAEKIRAAIKANSGYCCCSLVKDDRHKCICADFREKNTPGPCHCGLYFKVED